MTAHSELIAVILGLLFTSAASAQSIPYRDAPAPSGFAVVPQPAAALDLLDTGGSSVGKVWVQQWRDSVVIWGKVDGVSAQWARFPLELRTRAHVNLWLSVADAIALPKIGWGNQFGYLDCTEYKTPTRVGAEDCATWSARQVLYRNQLRRLFIREWQLTQDVSTEVVATVAYRQALTFASDREREAFTKLEPAGRVSFLGGSDFQIIVPLASFPPASSLELSQIYIVVEVAEGERIVASTSPAHKPDDPSSFKRLALGRPITSRITPCGYPLMGVDKYEQQKPAWYMPARDGVSFDTFVLANDANGYRYDPQGLSPVALWTHHFIKELGDGNLVCGPNLRFIAGNNTWEYRDTIDERQLKVLKLPDGSYLLKSGPTFGTLSPFGSGQCGACLTARVSVFRLDPVNGIGLSFAQEMIFENPESDADFQFSDDWKTVTVYKGKPGLDGKMNWSSSRYCFSNGLYNACGTGPAGPPPNPRQTPVSR